MSFADARDGKVAAALTAEGAVATLGDRGVPVEDIPASDPRNWDAVCGEIFLQP
jgi:hypothetical protein